MLYGGALFKVTFSIRPDGEVVMLNDSPVAEGLAVAYEHFAPGDLPRRRRNDDPRAFQTAAELADAARQIDEGHWHRKAGRYVQAAESFRQGLETRRRLLAPTDSDLAHALGWLALALNDLGRYTEAEPLYRESLAIRRAALPVGHPDIAAGLNNLAGLLETTGRYTEAEPLYREALAIYRAPPTRDHEVANGLNNLARLLQNTGRYTEAEPLYLESLAMLRAALHASHPDIAAGLNNLAGLLETTGRYTEAEPLYRESLAIRRTALHTGDPDIATGLDNLAGVLQTTGRYTEAEPLYRESLAIRRAALPVGHPDIAAGLNNLAGLLATTGRYAEAEPLYRDSLAILRAVLPAGHRDTASGVNNLAEPPQTNGRYSEASPDVRAPAGHGDIPTALQQLAWLRSATGRYRDSAPQAAQPKSRAILRAALPAGNPDIAAVLNNLAWLLATTGRTAEAESLYRESLAIRRSALRAGHPDIATGLNHLAWLLATTGRYPEAEPLYRESLEIQRAALPAGHPNIAGTLHRLAELLTATARRAEAEPLYQEALRIAQGAGVPERLWKVQGSLSDYYAAQDQSPLAIFFGKQAVNTLQAVRQALAQGEPATQQAFVSAKEDYYRHLADRLIAAGRLPEAQQVLDMLKEHEQFDYLRRDAAQDPRHGRATLNPIESAQQSRLDADGAELGRLGAELRTLQQVKPMVRTAAEKERIAALESDLRGAGQRFQVALTEVKAAFAALDRERYAQAQQRLAELGDNQRGLIRDLERLSGQRVALLNTVVLKDKTQLLLTLAEVQEARQAAIGEADLNTAIQTLRTALTDPHGDPRPAARALYDRLFAPVAPILQAAGIQTLMVGLDGALRYLPLAALYDGEHWLAERYALSLYTASSIKNLRSEPPPQQDWSVAGLGVSRAHSLVYHGVRSDFTALAAVPGELDAVVRTGDTDPEGVLPGSLYLDPAFTRATFEQSLRERYPVLHIASHFAFRPGNNDDSFLLLGDGQALAVADFTSADYDLGGIDLITLSACETAMSAANAQGREIEGLGGAVQARGAKGVIATLWPVDDASTGVLMQHFYRLRAENPRLTKAQALQLAQLQLMGSERAKALAKRGGVVRNLETDAEAEEQASAPGAAGARRSRYDHPYYWAPFILMGNWL